MTCVIIAVTVVLSVTSLWPAGLAIVISGAALSMAMTLFMREEPHDLTVEVDDLSKAQAELQSSLRSCNDVIQELADLTEQVASHSVRDHQQVETGLVGLRTDLDDLRADIGALKSAPAVDEVVDLRLQAVNTRLAALETKIAHISVSHDGTLELTETFSPSAAMPGVDAGHADPSSFTGGMQGVDKGDGHAPGALSYSVMDQEATVPGADDTNVRITLAPVFEPDLAAPVAFILSSHSDDQEGDLEAILSHAVRISVELEEAGREILLLLRVSPDLLSSTEVRDRILLLINDHPALQRRLTLLTRQDGFSPPVHSTVSAIAERGCRFAMEEVRDWSLDLGVFAASGLRFIIVDALAMVDSAREQGGDPRRLAQALGLHDISLIAGGITSKADMDMVLTLEPALVAGDGLGGLTVLEPSA